MNSVHPEFGPGEVCALNCVHFEKALLFAAAGCARSFCSLVQASEPRVPQGGAGRGRGGLARRATRDAPRDLEAPGQPPESRLQSCRGSGGLRCTPVSVRPGRWRCTVPLRKAGPGGTGRRLRRRSPRPRRLRARLRWPSPRSSKREAVVCRKAAADLAGGKPYR